MHGVGESVMVGEGPLGSNVKGFRGVERIVALTHRAGAAHDALVGPARAPGSRRASAACLLDEVVEEARTTHRIVDRLDGCRWAALAVAEYETARFPAARGVPCAL